MNQFDRLYQQIIDCFSAKAWQKMARLCQEAIQIKPEDASLYKYLGYGLQMQGKNEPAIRAYQLTHKYDSSLFSYQTFYRLGVYFYKRGLTRPALICYETNMAIQKLNDRLHMRLLLQQKSNNSKFTDFLDLALLAFQKSLIENRTFISTYEIWVKSLPNPDRDVLSRLQFLKQVKTSPHYREVYRYISNYLSSQTIEPQSYNFPALSLSAKFPKEFYLKTEKWCLESKENGRFYQQISKVKSIHLQQAKTISVLAKTIPYYLKEFSFEAPETFVAIVPNGRLSWGLQSSTLDTQSCGILTSENQLLADVSPIFPITGPGFPDSPIQDHWMFKQGYPINCPEYEGTIAVLAELNDRHPFSSPNYFHWFVDTLPRLDLLYRSNIDFQNIDRFLFSKFSVSFQKETLELLNFPIDRIWNVDDYPHIRARQLIVPSFAGKLTTIVPRSVQFLRDSFLPHQRPTQFGDRIYISRKNARYRRVINEDEVMEILQKFGFEIVAPESLSFREQVALFNRAQFIISPHGAGLTNIVFCQPKTTIVEIFAPGCMMPYYWIVANAANLNYYYITGTGLPDPYLQKLAYPNPQMEDICVNISYLVEVLKVAGIR